LGINISFMIAEQNYGAHSAQVQMRLIVNGESISITHMGPDFLLIEPGHAYPPGEETIVLRVDASERSWEVILPHGISASSERVVIAAKT
jgi:hypothetical protein